MKIYVRDDIYEYLTIGKRDIHSGVDDDLVVKSLEQHDKELLREFADKVISQIDLYRFVEELSKNTFRNLVNADFLRAKIEELLKERGIE